MCFMIYNMGYIIYKCMYVSYIQYIYSVIYKYIQSILYKCSVLDPQANRKTKKEIFCFFNVSCSFLSFV